MEFLQPPVKGFKSEGRAGSSFPLRFTFEAVGRGSAKAAGYIATAMGREFGVQASRAESGRSADLLIETGRGLLGKLGGLSLPRTLKDQAYRLIWRPGRKVSIQAESEAGAFCGAVTLRQVLAAQIEGVEIPAGVIEDWPSLEWRGLQDDLARGRVFNMAHAKRQILRLAEMKGNLYQLYIETRFAFPSRPDAGMPGSMTPADARELESYAAGFCVTLLPQVNTQAHMELLLSKPQYKHLREKADDPFVICPSHPETRPLLRDLLNDIMDSFASPLIPVGLDEVWHIGVCPRCRKREPGKIFLDHINFLHKVVTGRGRRMLVWHDMLLDRNQFAGSVANGSAVWADRVLEALPRDIIICDWQYTSSGDTTHYLAAKGFDTMACNFFAAVGTPCEVPFDFTSAWHTSRLLAQARRAGACGAIQTTWGDGPSLRAFENQWFLYAHSLSTAWEPAQRVRLRRMAADWARSEMGIDGLAYEELLTRMSVPLLHGADLSFFLAGKAKQVFPNASRWWKAAGAELIAGERTYADDLANRLSSLRHEAKRGHELLALLDIPILLRRLGLDEVALVGQAAALYELAVKAGWKSPKGRRLAERASKLIITYADRLGACRGLLERLDRVQGIDQDQLVKFHERQSEIRKRAEKMLRIQRPAFGDIFWPLNETQFGR